MDEIKTHRGNHKNIAIEDINNRESNRAKVFIVLTTSCAEIHLQ